ncbi:MAG: hypothetical protein EA383_01295 [Spirochaetaceae bacterium]|nr:MAG: hypothetical protein EA383_01295 [Spirochaetaceae bacterium]
MLVTSTLKGTTRAGFGILFLLACSVASGFDFPLENARYILPENAADALAGRWKLVAAYDTEFPDFVRNPGPDEVAWADFRSDRSGTDATVPEQHLEFTWEVVEENLELWLEMILPEYDYEFRFKLIFHEDQLILYSPSLGRYMDEPMVDVVIYERM